MKDYYWMLPMIGYVIATSVVVGVLVYLLSLSNEKQTVLMYVSDCIDKHVSEEGFIGEPEDEWNAYVTKCFNEYKTNKKI